MTAAERLVLLSGRPGRTAGEQLRMIAGALATTGALLVAYSGLPTGTAAEHILVDHVQEESGQVFGAGAAGSKIGHARLVSDAVSHGTVGGAIAAPSAAVKHAPAQVQPSTTTGPSSTPAPDPLPPRPPSVRNCWGPRTWPRPRCARATRTLPRF